MNRAHALTRSAMILRGMVCFALLFALRSTAAAQDHIVTINDVEAPLHGIVEVPVKLNTFGGGIDLTQFTLTCDENALRCIGWREGAGLLSYLNEVGDPESCDVFVYPSGVGLFGWWNFYVPFSSATFGNDWIVVKFEVVADHAQSSTIEARTFGGPGTADDIVDTAVIQIIDFGPRIRPSDANSDYAVNLLDCVDVLQFLFDGHDLSCAKAADFDDSGALGLVDAMGLLNGLFNGGPLPLPICKFDTTLDTLACNLGACP